MAAVHENIYNLPPHICEMTSKCFSRLMMKNWLYTISSSMNGTYVVYHIKYSHRCYATADVAYTILSHYKTDTFRT